MRTARPWSALLITTATLLLAACGPTPPAETAAPPTSSTPRPTPTETPSPTPSPTAEADVEDPADTSTWIIDGNGIGPIDIGTDYALLESYLPGMTDTECAISSWQRSDGLSIAPVTGFEHDGVYGVNMSAPTSIAEAPATAAGITIGSTQADVVAAYPGVPTVEREYFPSYLPVPLDGRFVIVILTDGLVSGFAVSDYDILPSDYC